MALTEKQFSDIKEKIKEFSDNNAFTGTEANTETHYIVPILKILGWKTANIELNKTQDRGSRKRPDILLNGSSGRTLFVVESKEPNVNKGLDGGYHKIWSFAEQISNYCGGAGISWGALTNFVEWRICNPHTLKLNETYYKTLVIFKDKINVSTDKELRDFFGLLDFSFLNNAKGKVSLDVAYYKKQDKIKEEFFFQLTDWRSSLRNYLAKNYRKELSINEIDNQTQRILDRLIFIDFCFDKDIIYQDYLSLILFSKTNYYTVLKKIFSELNEMFNSEMFSPDKCDEFFIDDKILEPIIKGVSNVDFSLLNVHVLGEVYEDYLGELIKNSNKKTGGDEEKEHQKRKTHGIFYTPDYIVNYIIDNTLSELLNKCHSINEIEKIKVIDIACGSGSFLIRAFDILYNAYIRVIGKNKLDVLYDLEIRKKILLHNLYGVDLDEKAIEIAKLNLLLRGLEGLNLEFNFTDRKILPNLKLNIRCGNSLVSGKYETEEDNDAENNKHISIFDNDSEYKSSLGTLLKLKDEFYKEENNIKKDKLISEILKHEDTINKYLNKTLRKYYKEVEKVNPFNYEVAFCEIMNPKCGGFDCVIGNPPYKMLSRVTGMSADNSNNEDKVYLNENFINSAEYKLSIYAIFSNKALSLLKQGGKFGYILPDSYILGFYFSKFRNYLINGFHVNQILLFMEDFWKKASVGLPSILIATKDDGKEMKCIEAKTTEDFKKGNVNSFVLSQDYYNVIPRNKLRLFFSKFEKDILEKIESNKQNLGDVVKIQVGVRSKIGQDKIVSSFQKNTLWKKGLIDGDEVLKYRINYKNNYIHINPIVLWAGGFDEDKIKSDKLIIRKTGDKIISTIDTKGYFHLDNLHFGVLVNKEYSLKYILGIINSDLFRFYYQKISLEKGRAMAQTDIDTLHSLKIPVLNNKNITNKKLEMKLIGLVDEMVELNKHPEKNKSEIETTDLEINNLVYLIYKITDKERKTIKEKYL